MENQTFASLKSSVKHWYFPLILGIIFIAIGAWVLRTPVESYITLAILFSISFFMAGILEIIFSIANRKELRNWGWSLASGIIDFLIGVLLVSIPAISIVVLPVYVGFAIMFRSILAIGWSVELHDMAVLNWGYMLVMGILGLMFSFILLWNPLFAGMTIVFYTSLAFIFIGFFYIFLSFRLKKLSKSIKNK